MKCPKCEYLGFDTGDRCRNCGYDFSLIAAAAPDPAGELSLHTEPSDAPIDWLSDLEAAADHDVATAGTLTSERSARSAVPAMDAPRAPAPAAPAVAAVAAAPATSIPIPAASSVAPAFELPEPSLAFRGEAVLPLFTSESGDDDEPLIKLPAQPRPPLAVRRTPETPRLRAVPRPPQRATGQPGDATRLVDRPADPQLDFLPETAAAVPATASRRGEVRTTSPRAELTTSPAGPRIIAAAIDHLILAAVDVIVLYLTLRIAQLDLSDIRGLPILPMGAFLGLLKLAYFTAFTCVGGQTIGKMAARIRVVGDDQRALDAPHAIHRALAGAVSFLTFGLGFLPALFAVDHRALHDRLAHTRVVVLPGA